MLNAFEQLVKSYRANLCQHTQKQKIYLEELESSPQRPEAMLISCCDSRVNPTDLLKAEPGDLFVVRNIAAIVPPFEANSPPNSTAAALEFGVCGLGVKHIILMGHSQCGGIKKVLAQKTDTAFIDPWINLLNKNSRFEKKTKSKVPPYSTPFINECAQEALHVSYENSLTFPFIKEKVEKNLLCIHRWFFNIKTSTIFAYKNDSSAYEPL